MHLIFSLPSAHPPRRPSFIHALDVRFQLEAPHDVPSIMSQGKLHASTAGSERCLMAIKQGCLMAWQPGFEAPLQRYLVTSRQA